MRTIRDLKKPLKYLFIYLGLDTVNESPCKQEWVNFCGSVRVTSINRGI